MFEVTEVEGDKVSIPARAVACVVDVKPYCQIRLLSGTKIEVQETYREVVVLWSFAK